VRETEGLGRYLEARSRYDATDLLLLGDFQIEQPGSTVHKAILASGVQVPDEVLLPTNLDRSRYYDLIGFASAIRDMPLGPSRPRGGTVDLYRHVLRDEDLPIYAATDCYRSFMRPGAEASDSEARERHRFRLWKSYLLSDHLPLWAELAIPTTA
jgi:hypothetical protein